MPPVLPRDGAARPAHSGLRRSRARHGGLSVQMSWTNGWWPRPWEAWLFRQCFRRNDRGGDDALLVRLGHHVFVDQKWPTHRGRGHTTVTTNTSWKAVLRTGFTRRSTSHVGPTKGGKPEVRSVTIPASPTMKFCARIADQDLLWTKDWARVFIGARGSRGTASWCQNRIFVKGRKGDIV